MMVERLFLGVPRGCLRFVIVVFPDHTHLLFLCLLISCLPGSALKTDVEQMFSKTCLVNLIFIERHSSSILYISVRSHTTLLQSAPDIFLSHKLYLSGKHVIDFF